MGNQDGLCSCLVIYDGAHKAIGRIGGQSPIRRASRKFVVSFADVELDASDIWDEDEMPENPTPADVIEVMRSGEHSGPLSVACDWVLIESLYVRSGADADADEEVEWDGT